MKKYGYLAIAVLVTFLATSAFAAPSAKFSAQVSKSTLIKWTAEDGFKKKILTTTIKTPNKKDLLIGVSLETGLYTNTLVKDKYTGALDTSDTSNAIAGISISVYLDGQLVAPSPVIYDRRDQKLSAKLGGILSDCVDLDGDGHITLDECTLTDEEIQLILDTMGAHHFNFVAANLEPGDHTLTVVATIEIFTEFTNGLAEAKALVGKGSLTVEEVRATNSPDGIEFLE